MADDPIKIFFQEQAARRKENAIKHARFTVTMDSISAGVLTELWDEWVTLLGKDRAVLLLSDCMLKWTEGLREAKRLQDKKRGRR